MESILEPIERNRLTRMLSNDNWMNSDSDKDWAARLLLDFGYIQNPKGVVYFMDYPQRREPQLREILEMN